MGEKADPEGPALCLHSPGRYEVHSILPLNPFALGSSKLVRLKFPLINQDTHVTRTESAYFCHFFNRDHLVRVHAVPSFIARSRGFEGLPTMPRAKRLPARDLSSCSAQHLEITV
jgi:hypothetical protein